MFNHRRHTLADKVHAVGGKATWQLLFTWPGIDILNDTSTDGWCPFCRVCWFWAAGQGSSGGMGQVTEFTERALKFALNLWKTPLKFAMKYEGKKSFIKSALKFSLKAGKKITWNLFGNHKHSYECWSEIWKFPVNFALKSEKKSCYESKKKQSFSSFYTCRRSRSVSAKWGQMRIMNLWWCTRCCLVMDGDKEENCAGNVLKLL